MRRLFGSGRSFGDRITVAVTVTSFLAVIAAAVPLAISDYANLRHEAVATARSHAAMVSLDSAAALVFEDPVHAEEALDVLRAVPDVGAAVLYDAAGGTFASYQRAEDPAPLPALSPPGERFEKHWMFLTAPVVDLGATQGRLQIVYDLAPLGRRLRASLLLALLVAIGAMVMAFLIARRVRRGLVAPIDELVRTAVAVSQTSDYSRRAARLSQDELGQLTDAFNEMLSQIQKQEGELHGAHAERGKLLESERAARSEAERASRVKDEFLATLSHELRTPLTPILGWMEILKHAQPDAEQTRQGLDVVERNARMLTRIIDDLLDMSRIISGKVNLDVQRVELLEIIRAALEAVRPAAEARSIRVEATLDPGARWVRGDAARLQQVVWNLLSNAIRFTGVGGRVQVDLRRVDAHVEIVVRDTGQGIAADFLPHVFDRFRQADSTTTRQHGGLGLGLAIVRQLVELHGGSVRAESPGEGQGATFVVELPSMAARGVEGSRQPLDPARAQETALEELPSVSGLRVLVVDDDADARQLLSRILELRGAEVRLAESAPAALSILRSERLDVMVSDIGMPGMDGYELIRHARELGGTKSAAVPAIALTAYVRGEDRARALMAGYRLHLTKPVAPAELLVAVASLGSERGARRH